MERGVLHRQEAMERLLQAPETSVMRMIHCPKKETLQLYEIWSVHMHL
jgi:hypothetical protein